MLQVLGNFYFQKGSNRHTQFHKSMVFVVMVTFSLLLPRRNLDESIRYILYYRLYLGFLERNILLGSLQASNTHVKKLYQLIIYYFLYNTILGIVEIIQLIVNVTIYGINKIFFFQDKIFKFNFDSCSMLLINFNSFHHFRLPITI